MKNNRRLIFETCKKSLGSVCPIFLILTLYISFLTGAYSPFQEAYADGLAEERFSASLQGRNTGLLVKVSPFILTDDVIAERYFLLRLYDANSNQTVQYTTLYVTIEKGVGQGTKTLMPRALFHSENGILKLIVQPAEEELRILGKQEQSLGAWLADPSGTIDMRGPIFLEGGIYQIKIEIIGIDNISNILPPDEIAKFDVWLSVGDAYTEKIEYQGQEYDTTIISYYDSVKDLQFDADKQQFTWVMPFDWNVTRLQSTNFFLHEEFKMPKSLGGIGDATLFSATVNGNHLSGRNIAIDPYSSDTELTIHYLLSKDDILKIATENNQGQNSDMTFVLAPTAAVAPIPSHLNQEMITDTGGISIELNWSPDQLSADSDSTVKLDFSDAISGDAINSNVIYDLKILDSEGNEVFGKTDLMAVSGTATQTLSFPRDDSYQLEIAVKGLMKESQQSVDESRNGIARGVVVIPEFPVNVIMIVSTTALICVIFASRQIKK